MTTSPARKKLTDPACRAFKCPPERKQARQYDEKGLYLEALPSGKTLVHQVHARWQRNAHALRQLPGGVIGGSTSNV